MREIYGGLETPFYVYDREKVEEKCNKLLNGFPFAKILYSVKANSNPEILKVVKGGGLDFEVVSLGELLSVSKCCSDLKDVVFNGNGKTYKEVKTALEMGVRFFNFDSVDQLMLLEEVGKETGINVLALARIKPLVDVETHPSLRVGITTSKFGLLDEEIDEVLSLEKSLKKVKIVGIHSHIGSNIKNAEPFIKSAKRAEKIAKLFPSVEILNLGGGFSVDFEFKPLSEEYKKLTENYKIFIEPGRYIVANAGFIVSRVVSIKRGYPYDFLVLDVGMSEIIRPALYGAKHPIKALKSSELTKTYTVVGPICESLDVFGVYELPIMRRGDMVVIEEAGAYGYSMASNYNGRPKPAEYMLENGGLRIIRPRQDYRVL